MWQNINLMTRLRQTIGMKGHRTGGLVGALTT